MSVLLETSLGDLVVDLDTEGSPLLVENFLRLCHARYYTQTLCPYRVVPGRCLYGGDPWGDGTGGLCAAALERHPDVEQQQDDDDKTAALATLSDRFLASQGRRLTPDECREKGRLVAVELEGIADTVGSQFLITIDQGPGQALDGYTPYASSAANTTDGVVQRSRGWLSLGKVVEDDNNVLQQINDMSRYNIDERPMADIRLRRALIVYNPRGGGDDDKLGWSADFLRQRGVEFNDQGNRVIRSPSPERPASEKVSPRIPMETFQKRKTARAGGTTTNNKDDDDDDDSEEDPAQVQRRLREEAEAERRHDDQSRARVLEMLGDLPDAEATAPKNVLFVAKLNPLTTDEDLQLIFSRFDPQVRVDIIRDHDTGQSLQYAFCAFTTEQQAVQAYFKMNQALVDDRRILVDFSQSVAHVWDKYRQRYRHMPQAPVVGRGGSGGAGGGRRPQGRGGREGGSREGGGRRHRRREDDRPRGGGGEHGHHPRRPTDQDHGSGENNHHHHRHHQARDDDRFSNHHRRYREDRHRHSHHRNSQEHRRHRDFDDEDRPARGDHDIDEGRRHDRHRRVHHDADDYRKSDETSRPSEERSEERQRRRQERHRRRRYDSDQESHDDGSSSSRRRRKKKRHKRHRSERDDRRHDHRRDGHRDRYDEGESGDDRPRSSRRDARPPHRDRSDHRERSRERGDTHYVDRRDYERRDRAHPGRDHNKRSRRRMDSDDEDGESSTRHGHRRH